MNTRPAAGITALYTGFGHFVVPNLHVLSSVLRCYFWRASLLIMSRLRAALQSVSLFLLFQEFASTREQAAVPEVLQRELSAFSSSFLPTAPVLISCSDVLLEGPSPPFFWRLKELQMSVSLSVLRAMKSESSSCPQQPWWPEKGSRSQ